MWWMLLVFCGVVLAMGGVRLAVHGLSRWVTRRLDGDGPLVVHLPREERCPRCGRSAREHAI